MTSAYAQITHIITGLEVGGAERALHTLLTNGLEGPFRNRVISLMGPGHYGPLLEAAGIPVTCLNIRPGRPSPLSLRWLFRACSEAPASVLQGWMTHGNISATLVQRYVCPASALAWNIRWSLEGLADAKLSTRVLTRVAACISAGPQAIIYNSERSREQHEVFGFSDARALHLPNGFDTSAWAPDPATRASVRAELGLRDDAEVIGFVGRAHPDKGPDTLFNAFAALAEVRPRATLVAVGRDLERFGTLSSRVVLTGQRADVARLMQAFDLFCLSSRVEGFPNALGEAMASGLPCVTTDVGDARAIVGETGWVVPPRDAEALADALRRALEMPSAELRQRGLAARARIEQEFSITKVVSSYVALYDRLIEGASRCVA